MKHLSFLLLAISSYAYNFEIKYAYNFEIKNEKTIIPIEEVTSSQFFEELKNIPKEEMDNFLFKNWDPNRVVEFKKGVQLPLKIFLKGEFFNLLIDDSYPMVILKKDLFIRIKDKKFLFSEDLKDWKEASYFFKGNATISVESNNGSPLIKVGAELNKK